MPECIMRKKGEESNGESPVDRSANVEDVVLQSFSGTAASAVFEVQIPATDCAIAIAPIAAVSVRKIVKPRDARAH